MGIFSFGKIQYMRIMFEMVTKCSRPNPTARFGKIHCKTCREDIAEICCLYPDLTVRFGKVFCRNYKLEHIH